MVYFNQIYNLETIIHMNKVAKTTLFYISLSSNENVDRQTE